MKIRNLNELLPKLKKFLPQYLELQGIKVDGNKVQCPNHALHNNDDGNLSAGFVPKSDNTVVWCFVENRKFDIIDCYHILEKKPITGQLHSFSKLNTKGLNNKNGKSFCNY